MEHNRNRLLGELEINNFIEALTSNGKSSELPEEYNYFGKLVGSWKLDYTDHNMSCSVEGEWHFSWVLEGMAIQIGRASCRERVSSPV